MDIDKISEEKKKSVFSKVSEVLITMASKPSGLIGLSILVFHIFLAFLKLEAKVNFDSLLFC